MPQPPPLPPTPPPPPECPSRLEIALSAAACPGAGQFLQGRWPIALLFTIGALVTAGFFLREAVLPNFTNLAIVLGMGGHDTNEPLHAPSLPRMLIFLAAFLVVYLASLADAVAAYRRRLRTWQRQTRERPL